MGKKKHSPEWMIDRVQDYLSGKGSLKSIARSNGIGYQTLRYWVKKYNEHGETVFYGSTGNKSYSKEFKKACVEAVLSDSSLVDDIVIKFNISSSSVLRRWISEYNANKELKDYDPKREVYMAEAHRKTTLEERKEIVEYCIRHNKDYKGTASRYDVSYSQVYSWVKKYDKNGEEALTDKRGHHKSDDEVDEMERLRRENQRLKKKLEENDMLIELLKKVKEFEGM